MYMYMYVVYVHVCMDEVRLMPKLRNATATDNCVEDQEIIGVDACMKMNIFVHENVETERQRNSQPSTYRCGFWIDQG